MRVCIYFDQSINTGKNNTHLTICIKHNGRRPGKYRLDQGDGRGFVTSPQLTLAAGQAVIFQVDDDLSGHPFVLTNDENIGSVPLTTGVKGNNPAIHPGDTLVYTPPSLNAEQIYYQAQNLYNVGNVISLINVCDPTRPNLVCITLAKDDGEGDAADLAYYVDAGDGKGPILNGDITVTQGGEYILEMVGDFSAHPLSVFLSNHSDASADASTVDDDYYLNIGVGLRSGTQVGVRDNDQILLQPQAEGPSHIFYHDNNNR